MPCATGAVLPLLLLLLLCALPGDGWVVNPSSLRHLCSRSQPPLSTCSTLPTRYAHTGEQRGAVYHPESSVGEALRWCAAWLLSSERQ